MMDFKNLVYYGMMEAEQASGGAAALFNIRWQRLVEIQNDLAERFVDQCLASCLKMTIKG